MPWVVADTTGPFAGMLTWEPIKLPQDLLDQLLDCLRVPGERREEGALFLRGLFGLAQEWPSFDLAEPKRQQAREQLATLAKKTAAYRKKLNKRSDAKKTAAYREELDKLGDVARVWLGLQDYRLDYFYYVDQQRADAAEQRLQINDLMEFTDGIAQARVRYKDLCSNIDRIIHGESDDDWEQLCSTVDRIYAASAADFWADFRPTRHGRSRKRPGGPYETSFEHWVGTLWWRAEKEGWHLTVSPRNGAETGTGTLLDFLNFAREHLPPGFVPRALDEKRLQRIRQAYKRKT